MAEYKGVEVDDCLLDLVQRMDSVEEYRENLQTLQAVWDNLTLLGHLSGTGTDMTETRRAFHRLTGSLLNQLGQETQRKTVLAMKSKAQVAIDIMVRNLFERTADIGFLAMDDAVRDFLQGNMSRGGKSGDTGEPIQTSSFSEKKELANAMRERFREYVRKYSVYSNIILLDPEGNVVVQLDSDNAVRKSADPLIQETLHTHSAYVEVFRHTDLLPNQGDNLIYAYRVTSRDGKRNLGVLCLCFRFENETEGIFANLVKPDDWSVLTLLNADGKVIASSDAFHVPVGATLTPVVGADWRVVRFAGREYLATTRPTQGYQGYLGPGWVGHCMIPLDHAFRQASTDTLASMDGEVLEAVMHNPTLFSQALRDIPIQAAQIQRCLNRSVWNGNVRQRTDRKAMNPAFSKVLLWEISNTGLKTQDVFERSIGNLHQTVVSSILQDSEFQAALAIDIMDRNLYERANDCRWWALAPTFRNALGSPEIDVATANELGDTLSTINGLYTVYDNLVLFDRQGRVVAVSNPEYHELCERPLAEEWVSRTLSLRDSQSYAVSAFTASPLYKGRHTYIYSAAIRATAAPQSVVGGIGIVFDAAPQFEAMLNDALPRATNGDVLAGCFGLFCDRHRQVIASTLPQLQPGTTMQLDEAYFQLGNGGGKSGIANLDGRYYAVGARMSKGYREYKGGEDAYHNDVVALVFVPLGERGEDRRHAPAQRLRHAAAAGKDGNGVGSVEIATFYVDNCWLGLPSENVVEAIDAKGITSVPGAADNMSGYLMFRDNIIPVVGLWGMLGKQDRRHASENPQIVVVRRDDGDERDFLGIYVDELGEIPEIPMDRIEKISPMLAGENVLAESLVKPNGHEHCGEMLVVLSPERLYRRFLAAKPEDLAECLSA